MRSGVCFGVIAIVLLLVSVQMGFAAEVDKTSYQIGEKVIIRTTPGAVGITLSSSEDSYKFLGDLDRTIAYTPQKNGTYIIEELQSDGSLTSTSFAVVGDVIDTSIATIVPERSQEPIHESQVVEQLAAPVFAPRAKEMRELAVDELALTNINPKMRIRSSRGTGWLADIEIDTPGKKVRTSTGDLGSAPTSGRGTVRISLKDRHVKSLTLNKASSENGIDLGLDEFEGGLSEAKIENRLSTMIYAIDPEAVDFSDGSFTAIASGTELHKCKDWNFTLRSCQGAWVKIMDTLPGEEYTVQISPADPGFAETIPATGIVLNSTVGNLSVSASVATFSENKRFFLGITVYNPTNQTLNVSRVSLNSPSAIFSTTRVAIDPSTGWGGSTTLLSWSGTKILAPYSAAQFIVVMQTNSQNIVPALVFANATTNVSSLSNAGYFTSEINANFPSHTVYFTNSTSGPVYEFEAVAQDTASTYNVRINNSGDLAVPVGTILTIQLPDGWTDVNAASQTGWNLGTIMGDEGTGWLLIPQTESTTIGTAGGTRDFQFNATPPDGDEFALYQILTATVGPPGGGSTARMLYSTTEIAMQANNGTPRLDADDDRYLKIATQGGAMTLQQFISIPAPFDDIRGNKWGIVVVNPTDFTVNVTQIDWTADTTVFGTPAGIFPSSTWSKPSTSNIRWAGNVMVPAHGVYEFVMNLTANTSATGAGRITITTDTTAGTLTTSGWRTFRSTGSIQYPSLYGLNATRGATYLYNVTAGSRRNYTIRLDNSGASAAVGTNTMLEIRIPSGWKNISAAAQTNWTILSVNEDPNGGGIIRAVTATATIAAHASREFSFYADAPMVGGNSTYRFDYFLRGPTGQSNALLIQSIAQLAVTVTPQSYGINVSQKSYPANNTMNITTINITAIVKSLNSTFVNLSILNTRTGDFEELQSGTLSDTEAWWGKFLRMNRTFDVRDYINTSSASSDYGKVIIRWFSPSSNQTAILEDVLNFSVEYELGNLSVVHDTPYNNSFWNTTNITLFYNASDDYDLRNCSLFINGTLNQTNTSPTNASTNSFNVTFAASNYTWSIGCFDLNGNYNLTGNFTIAIDTILPTINLTSPLNNTKFNSSNVTFTFRPNDTYLANCSVILDDQVNVTNDSVNSSAQNSLAILGIQDGQHNWSISCTDLAGNTFVNGTRNFTVDTTPPASANASEEPVSSTPYNVSQLYRFNTTWTDNNSISAVIFESNFSGAFTNATVNVTAGAIYSYNLSNIPGGSYVWRMYANDTYGNWQTSLARTYVVSRATSDILLLLNESAENYPVETGEQVNITGIVLNPGFGYLEIYVNGTRYAAGSSLLQNLTSFSANGTMNVTLIFNETRNYSESRKSLNVVIGDKQAPVINRTYPLNASYVGSAVILFTFNISDQTGVDTCILYINGTANASNSSMTNNGPNTMTGGPFSEGTYSYFYFCNDTLNNRRNTSNFTFTVDLASPSSFTITSPPNATVSSNQSPTFAWTASADTHFANYTMFIDNAIDFSSPNFIYNTTGETTYAMPDVLADGVWHWRVIAYDFAGNERISTDQFNYVVDTTPADVIINAPQNASYVNSAINITYTPTDSNMVDNCTLTFNDSTSYSNLSIAQNAMNSFVIIKGDGDYLWSVSCTDEALNQNSTSEYMITVDTVPPTPLVLIGPANNTFSNDNTPNLSWSQTVEEHFENYTVLVSDNELFTNINFSYGTTPIDNTSYEVPAGWGDGTWYWKIVAWDRAGNWFDPFFVYTIDASSPGEFDLDTPLSGSASTNTTPTLNWTNTSDLNFDNYTVLVSDDELFSHINFTYVTNDSLATFVDVDVGWPDNTIWYWKVIAYDNATNSRNSSSTFNYTTDSNAPIIRLRSPSNLSTYASNTSSLVTFVYNVSDLSDIASCTITANDSESISESTNLFVSRDINQSFTLSLASGIYNWSVSCSDLAGNAGVSESYILTVNISLPRIRLFDSAPYNNPQFDESANLTALAVYVNASHNSSVPHYRIWDNGWSAPANISDVGSTVEWVAVAANPHIGRSEEKVAATVSIDGWVDAMVWNGSSWQTFPNVASMGTTADNQRSFDVGFETQRGRAMLVYSINSTNTACDLGYRIYNGTGWLPETCINDPSTAADITVTYVRIARNPDPESNELAIAYIDATNADGKAMIWNGTDWGQPINITTAIAITTEETIDVAYEQSSKKILAVAGTGSTVAYASYNRSTWNLTGTTDINPSAAGTTNFLRLKANPAGNEIMIIGNDGQASSDLSTALWSNSVWSGALRHDAGVDTGAARTADFDWEQTGNAGVMAWGTTSGQIDFRSYTISGGWQAPSSTALGTGNAHTWVALYNVPGGSSDMKVLGLHQSATSVALGNINWTGSALQASGNLFTTAQPSTTFQSFDLAVTRYGAITQRWSNISLNDSVDGTQNQMTITGSGLVIMTNATSKVMGNYSALGVYMPQNARVSFVTTMSAMNVNISYATWEMYKVNSSGEYLLCSKGNRTRSSQDVQITASSYRNYTANCAVSADAILSVDDFIRTYMYVNSSMNNTITKLIDNVSTYVEFESYPLGNLSVAAIAPVPDPLVSEGSNATFMCQVNCSNGYCLNTIVTNELNDTTSTFATTSYFSGNVLLNQTAANPVILGTVNSSKNATFELIGSWYSFNNSMRCVATSDFINATSDPINVSVMDSVGPNITLIFPDDGAGYEPGNFTFTFNASDRRLGLCSLWGNWTGVWQLNHTISPNNGTFTDSLSLNISDFGVYAWNVNCSDLSGNDTFSTVNSTFSVAGDIMIQSSDISFDPASPVEGANVTIVALIRNNVNRNETNFNVSFFIGNPLLPGAVQIGPNVTVPHLNGSSTVTASISTVATIGPTNYFVLLDPPYGTGSIFEFNETNNIANNTLIVSMWQTYYGNISGNFTLDTGANFTFTNWGLANKTGNIFISDSDTTNGIRFAELYAFGRNTTGGANPFTVDDFSELDTALGVENFTDSVNRTYTNLGSPVLTRTYFTFDRTITNVPSANTTNGNFTTGILWDADDSTNAYYDASDREDIVFVTTINDTILTGNGLVDYEMMVPSRMKAYKGATPTVTLYYELQ